jgi:glycerol-3-phosphate acyltransferase PlsY
MKMAGSSTGERGLRVCIVVLNILLIIFAYLLGSIPTGLLLSRALAGKDPREQGSRNIGTTNVMRTAGKALGAMTLIGDALKGLIPVCIAVWLVKEQAWVAAVALAALVGHCFPIYLRFKGGKGVATALGIYLPLVPWAVLVNILVFASAIGISKMVSVGSLTAAIAMPLLIWVGRYPLPYLILSICVGLLIIYRHKENIQRLLQRKEHKL